MVDWNKYSYVDLLLPLEGIELKVNVRLLYSTGDQLVIGIMD